MKIFQQEMADGLSDVISQRNSLAYVAELKPAESQKRKDFIYQNLDKSEASANEQEDLYYLDSILVTTCWNKNDDVFNKEEVWAARNTPEHKPFNLEHDEKQIIGHITANWPVHENHSVISNDLSAEELPDTYHIVTSAVIYKNWTDPELLGRTESLIKEIESGSKFVSMECLFRGFDYAIMTPDGGSHIIARNEESSFLTKHLRSYGGDGVYEDYRVGRLLRDIAFCGKGLVDRPANLSSIIFNKYQPFVAPKNSSAKLLLPTCAAAVHNSNKEEILMSEVNMEAYKNQIQSLKAEVDTLIETNSQLEKKLVDAGAKQYEDTIAALEANVEADTQTIADLNSKIGENKETVEGLEAKIQEIEEAKSVVDSELSEIKEKMRTESRISILVEAGLDEDKATDTVAKFADLNDEQFEAIVQITKSAFEAETSEEDVEAAFPDFKKKDDEEEDDEKKKKKKDAKSEDTTEDEAEAEAEAADLDDVEADKQPDLSASSESDEIGHARSALTEFISNKYLKV